MDMVKVKENLDIANRKALEEIERKKMEIEREEKRIKEQIENATEKYKISKELAKKKARIDVCKRFEEELVLPDLQDNDHNSVEHIRKFLDTQPNQAVEVPEILDANDQPMPTSSNGNDRPTTSSPLNPLAHVYTSDMQSSSEILPAPPNQPPQLHGMKNLQPHPMKELLPPYQTKHHLIARPNQQPVPKNPLATQTCYKSSYKQFRGY